MCGRMDELLGAEWLDICGWMVHWIDDWVVWLMVGWVDGLMVVGWVG